MWLIFLTALAAVGLYQPYPEEQKVLFNWYWPERHWQYQDYTPYINSGDQDLRVLWQGYEWQPEQWDQNVYHKDAVLQRYYEADVIREPYYFRGDAVLPVGANFYHLSSQDKQNVVTFVNGLYDMTGEQGAFFLKDWATGRTIGQYSGARLYLN